MECFCSDTKICIFHLKNLYQYCHSAESNGGNVVLRAKTILALIEMLENKS